MTTQERRDPSGESRGVDNSVAQDTANAAKDATPAQLRRRRDASWRLPPDADGIRDPLDRARDRRRSTPTARRVISICQRPEISLVKGYQAADLLDAVGAPREWSRAGHGFTTPTRYVPDVLACAETWRLIVVFSEDRGAVA